MKIIFCSFLLLNWSLIFWVFFCASYFWSFLYEMTRSYNIAGTILLWRIIGGHSWLWWKNFCCESLNLNFSVFEEPGSLSHLQWLFVPDAFRDSRSSCCKSTNVCEQTWWKYVFQTTINYFLLNKFILKISRLNICILDLIRAFISNTFKYLAVVREERGPYGDPQHAYLYEGEDVWMAPGFINQFYEVSHLLISVMNLFHIVGEFWYLYCLSCAGAGVLEKVCSWSRYRKRNVVELFL